MKSPILVARIMRVLETDGQIGDGAGLADAFADAVKDVNARMESVQAAEASKQVSDAVRLMEEPPRLLDEINALDFNRLPDWEDLCERNGWQKPVPFDRMLLEKILQFGESKDVSEPFLKMYRKATLTNNNTLAVRALRRLREIDHSQDWETCLVQAEAPLQSQLAEQFAAARLAGDDEEQDRLAREILETAWCKKPAGRMLADVQAYWDAKESRRREAEGRENLALLKRCRDENWNRGLAFSMLQAIDLLVEGGWCLPADSEDLVDGCRRRVSEEMEAEERERRWRECCETLHGAIQREDTVAIREALAVPEFLDREPSEELLRDAQRVIEHEEAERRRKLTKIVVSSLLAIAAVLAVSGWWLKQKLFDVRCEGEAAKMATLAKGAHAIERMGEALNRLEADEPAVYADPRVNVYVGKLKTMTAKNLARTNELADILTELERCRERGWTDSRESVTGRFMRVEALLSGDDSEYRARSLKLKDSYASQMSAKDEARRENGTSRCNALVSKIKTLATRLKSEIGDGSFDAAIGDCKRSIAEWREDYAEHLPVLDGQLTEAEKELADAEQGQKNAIGALDSLKNAKTALEMLDAVNSLMEYYTNYPAIRHLKASAVAKDKVRRSLERDSISQKDFASFSNAGIDAPAFKTFLDESVKSLAEIPSFYSLYGLMAEGDKTGKFFAVSKGKPEMKRPSYTSSWQISGELLDFSRQKMVDKMEKKVKGVNEYAAPSVNEVKECVEIAGRADLTAGQFEDKVLELIKRHLDAVSDRKGGFDYLKNERRQGESKSLVRGRYTAYRRVQMLDIYFRWLRDDLKTMPPDDALTRWVRLTESAAQPLRVDNATEDLSWVCLWDDRVRARNNECLKLLEKIPADWTTQFRRWRKVRRIAGDIAKWKIETAGHLLFDPRNPYQKTNPEAIIPLVFPTVTVDHPLYVLREDANDRVKLRKALVPQKGKWARVAGLEMTPGEPLYQVERDGKPVDTDVEIRNVLKEFPEHVVKIVVDKIPLFEVEAIK